MTPRMYIVICGALIVTSGCLAEPPVEGWRRVDQGTLTRLTTTDRVDVISDAETWKKMWDAHRLAETIQAPAIDFEDEFVVAIFKEAESCDMPNVTNVLKNGSRHIVQYLRVPPVVDCWEIESGPLGYDIIAVRGTATSLTVIEKRPEE